MNTCPLVSVLMPVYNSASFVGEAAKSILDQSFTDFECVIVNDGSTDGSRGILDALAVNDKRIRLLQQANAGLVHALLSGAARCRGKYIARMDSDDVAHPERLSKQVQFLEENESRVVVGSEVELIDSNGQILGRSELPHSHEEIDSLHSLGRGTAIYHPASMFRRDAFESVGRYRPELFPAEDFDLWLRLAEIGQVGVLSDVLLKYRVHANSVSRQRSSAQNLAMWRAVSAAAKRRSVRFQCIPFNQLDDDQQLQWINVALDLGEFRIARLWSSRRLFARPSVARGKQFARALCGRWGKQFVPIYDSVLRRVEVRRSHVG